jgi:cytochrome c biogenesis protein
VPSQVKRFAVLSKKNPVWSFFTSVKLAIVLLVLISIASILGTLIPQQGAAGPLIGRLSPGVVDFMRSLQLFDVFHSAWFMILMALLAVNLIVCSINRFPTAWNRFRKKPEPDREDLFEKTPPDRTVVVESPLPAAAGNLENLLKKRFKGVLRKDAGERSCLYGEKGAYSHFGVYIIHASVLIMMAGVINGFLFGFEGSVEIPEGEATAIVALKGGRGVKNLDFAVRCDKFFIDFYENGMPKTYRSDLSFLRDGRVVQTSPVLVNHPVSFAGMRFYQANYGMVPSGDPVLVVTEAGKKIKDVKVAIGMEFDLPGKKAKAQMIRVEEDLMGMGPAVKLSIQSDAGKVQIWVFQAIEQIRQANPGLLQQVPLLNPGLFAPYVFSLGQAGSRYYTGLQVAQDPGVPVVAVGALLMMIGFMVVFFSSHRQIWVRLDKKEDKTRVRIAGRSNRDEVGLDREIRKLVDEVKSYKESAS